MYQLENRFGKIVFIIISAWR